MRSRSLEPLVLPALLVLAALLRFPDLATRGTWDGDQGHDMLVLRAFVRDGVVPLLGPPTSIGEVHHGAWYYYLLAPIAALTGGDSPLAVVTVIAASGVAAVGVVWWLARSIGGPLAGAVAGFVFAISVATVDESIFIWNPNLIALSSSVALAGAWRAGGWRRIPWRPDWGTDPRPEPTGWADGSPRWWLVAAAGTAVTMQCHVLGVTLLPVIAVPFVLDARRRSMGRVPLGIAAIFAAAYAPLLVNELTTGFSETRAAIDYLGSDRTSDAAAIPVRFGIVGLRVVSWPLIGLITDGLAAGVVATGVVVAIVVGLWRHTSRTAVRWLGLGLLWSSVFLTLAAPSLATAIPGLPNDHYHAFADPMVAVLVGLGFAAAIRGRVVASAAAAAGLVALVGWSATHMPPPVHPDGGYPAGAAAGSRVLAALAGAGVGLDDVVVLRSLPDFKSTESMAYPLVRAGQTVVAETPRGMAPGSATGSASGDARALVLLCDDLFRDAIGETCGGPAEDRAVAGYGVWGALLQRFEAHPGRWVSVYAAAPAT
ncbi:MAG: hypothetical protein WEG56_12760 [Chloroflexota bacterium]